MEVIPTIDLRGGKVVRLYQGNFQRETVYSDDPLSVALEWQSRVVPRIHIVDLNGAKSGSPVNLGVVAEIADRVEVPLQVGGGLRTLGDMESVARTGVQRIVLGTAAVRDPQLVEEACRALGRDAVVVGVDARDGQVAVQGWTKAASVTARELMEKMASLGVGRFIYTAIDRDGTLRGPDVQAIAELVEAIRLPIVASGGISSMEDLERLADIGVEGVIVGSALYEGIVDLQEAVQRFR